MKELINMCGKCEFFTLEDGYYCTSHITKIPIVSELFDPEHPCPHFIDCSKKDLAQLLVQKYGALYKEAKEFIEELGFEGAEAVFIASEEHSKRLDEVSKKTREELMEYIEAHPTHTSRGWGGTLKRWV